MVATCRYSGKRGAGYSLPGIWGCPPDLKSPPIWGTRGLIDTISTVSDKFEHPLE
jgi:hypothetical protein